MRREKSAGVIVFRMDGARPLYLLIQNSSILYWDFPKGLIEDSESEELAALRELEEETGLTDVRVLPGFRKTAEYFYTLKGERVRKEIVLFLAKFESGDVRLSWEHSDFRWVPFEQGISMLKERKAEVLRSANEFLYSRLDNWTKKK